MRALSDCFGQGLSAYWVRRIRNCRSQVPRQGPANAMALATKDRTWSPMGRPPNPHTWTRVFFATTIYSELGDRAATHFWTDRWLYGQCIADVAPCLFAVIAEETQEENCTRSPHQPYLDLRHTGGSHCWGHHWFSSSYGISYLILSCSLKLKIDTYGDLLQMVNIPLNQLMRAYFWDLFFSGHEKRFGRLGHHPNVISFCGWLLIIDVGQRIA